MYMLLLKTIKLLVCINLIPPKLIVLIFRWNEKLSKIFALIIIVLLSVEKIFHTNLLNQKAHTNDMLGHFYTFIFPKAFIMDF